MQETLSAVAGLVGGLVLGFILSLLVMSCKASGVSKYAYWLNQECWVRPCNPRKQDAWERHIVVAVSWKGAICVRRAVCLGEDGHWIKKQNVAWRVRWEDPRGADS